MWGSGGVEGGGSRTQVLSKLCWLDGCFVNLQSALALFGSFFFIFFEFGVVLKQGIPLKTEQPATHSIERMTLSTGVPALQHLRMIYVQKLQLKNK